MARIPEPTIHEIRERIDIVDLIGRYLSLRPSGRNFVGLCPFHNEKTPSFNVSRERQIWHCFGCGEGGHVFSFLVRHENLTFPEAVRQLAHECGIEIPEESKERSGIDALLLANEIAQDVYRKALASAEGETAREYLRRRGLDAGVIERFGVGLAPDRWDAVASALRARRVPAEVGERAGLLAPRKDGGSYDRLRGRVTFPIQDVRGRFIGFGGRALGPGQEPKYLNTPETPLFRKREALFGFPMALEPMRRTGRAVVVEGYFDLVALHRASIGEAVATCGTALTPEHAKNLRRRAREVVLLFDGDSAGQKAVTRALEVLLPEGLRVRAATLPAGDDPDTYLEREGAAALAALVDGAAPAIETVILRAAAAGVSTAWEKADAIGAVAPLLVLLTDAVERAEWVRRLALSTHTDPVAVERAVRLARDGKSIAATPEDLPSSAPLQRAPEDRHARVVARALLRHPTLAEHVEESDLMSLLPEGPWRDVVVRLFEAARSGSAPDPAGLAAALSREAAAALFAVAIDDSPERSAEEELRVLEQTLARLGKRRLADGRRETTLRFTQTSEVDTHALLAAKQRELDAKRSASSASFASLVSSGSVGLPPDGRR